MVRLAVPFAAGIAVGFAIEIPYLPAMALLSVAALAWLLSIALWQKWKDYHANPLFGLLMLLSALCSGMGWAGYHLNNRQYTTHFSESDSAFEAVVIAEPTKRTKTTQLELSVTAAGNADGEWRGLDTKILAYLHLDLSADTLLPGDVLFFQNTPKQQDKPPNPGQFDYGRYLTSQGFVATVYLKQHVTFYRPAQPPFHLKSFLEGYRSRAIALFDSHGIAPRELGVISALVLGKRELVDPEVRKAFTNAGTVHILAVSGLHVGIIYLFIAMVLGKVLPGRKLQTVRFAICILFLWLYAGITGFSPSVLRAATMFSFIALGKELGKFGSIYNMLAASAFVLLLANPFLLISVGFQLSYLAVTGIVTLYPRIYPLFVARWWWVDKVWALVVVSLSAQIATFPLTVYYFNQFPNYFLLSNLLVIPLATALLYGGVFCILLSWIPWFSDVVFLVTGFTAKVLNELVMWFSSLPSPVSEGLYMSALEAALCYALIGAGWVAYRDPRRGRLWAFHFTFLLLVGSFSFRKISGALRPEVAVFHVEGASVISVVQGKTARLHYMSVEKPDPSAFGFATMTYFNSRGVSEFQYSEREIVVECKGRIFMTASGVDELSKALLASPDFIFLDGYINAKETEMSLFPSQSVLVLDGAHPSYRRLALESALTRQEVKVWNTARRGAIRF